MADPNDVIGTKQLRREFNRRNLDITQADLRVTHGVAYIRGAIKTVKGGPTDIKKELEIISKAVRGGGVIKDVVIDCAIRS